jgi:hypothetical protein
LAPQRYATVNSEYHVRMFFMDRYSVAYHGYASPVNALAAF